LQTAVGPGVSTRCTDMPRPSASGATLSWCVVDVEVVRVFPREPPAGNKHEGISVEGKAGSGFSISISLRSTLPACSSCAAGNAGKGFSDAGTCLTLRLVASSSSAVGSAGRGSSISIFWNASLASSSSFAVERESRDWLTNEGDAVSVPTLKFLELFVSTLMREGAVCPKTRSLMRSRRYEGFHDFVWNMMSGGGSLAQAVVFEFAREGCDEFVPDC
jgi:hypothetical protein